MDSVYQSSPSCQSRYYRVLDPATYQAFSRDVYHYCDINEKLGDGAYGKVRTLLRWRRSQGGTPPDHCKRFAAKFIIWPDSCRRISFTKREVAVQSKLEQHPQILQLHDILWFPERQEVALVMPVATTSLSTYLSQNNRLNQEHVLWWFQQLIMGVDYCHKQGIVQRDLKPDNLLLLNNTLQLADFGLSKDHAGAESGPKTLAGTAWYEAPEVLRIQPTPPSTPPTRYAPEPADIWSCGVILFQMLFPDTFHTICSKTPLETVNSGNMDWQQYIPAQHPVYPEACLQLLRQMLRHDAPAWNPCKCQSAEPTGPQRKPQLEGSRLRATMGDILANAWFSKDLPVDIHAENVRLYKERQEYLQAHQQAVLAADQDGAVAGRGTTALVHPMVRWMEERLPQRRCESHQPCAHCLQLQAAGSGSSSSSSSSCQSSSGVVAMPCSDMAMES